MTDTGFTGAIAQAYDATRSGYSTELYDTIAALGLRRGASILDVGCGTGLASEPFARNGFAVTGVDASEAMLAKARERVPEAEWVVGAAEQLPFPDARFDVTISAQAFHWFDRQKAIAEILRVLKRGGIVAIWWKLLMAEDPVKVIRDRTIAELGFEPPASGLGSGFREFYGAGFVEPAVRVLPWRFAMPLSQFLGMERSRVGVWRMLGEQSEAYYTLLEQRLRERFAGDDPGIPLGYMQYLYLGKKA